jgi:hypothetical protein
MTSVKPPRSELAYASFLACCPRGDTDAIRKAKNFVLALKENRVLATGETASARVARRLRERDDVASVTAFLDAETTLVPIPRSGLRRKGDLWPALEIARELEARGFGSVLTALERTVAISKAATAAADDRPKARTHSRACASMSRFRFPRGSPSSTTVTKGAQFFGAAWAIWAARSNVEVRAFAVVRTESKAADFRALLDPCIGQIEWRDEECRRRP